MGYPKVTDEYLKFCVYKLTLKLSIFENVI